MYLVQETHPEGEDDDPRLSWRTAKLKKRHGFVDQERGPLVHSPTFASLGEDNNCQFAVTPDARLAASGTESSIIRVWQLLDPSSLGGEAAEEEVDDEPTPA